MKIHLYAAFALLAACSLAWPHTLRAALIEVSPKGPVTRIRDAVERANACDTIVVRSGLYKEGNLLLRKPLTLMGMGGPIIDGEHKCELFTVAAPNVTIRGFVLRNSGRSNMEDWAGVKCLDAHYAHICDNVLENTFFGIHLSNSDYVLIENNQLSTYAEQEYELGNGIHLWKCAYARIFNNQIRGHRDGIYFEFVTHSAIRFNLSEENRRYGLHFMFSHDDQYFDNIFRNNGAGVAVMYTRRVKMYRNRFTDNWGASAYGMLLKDISDSEIFDNTFSGNTSGVYMEGSSRCRFQRNTWTHNGWAVKIMASCDDNNFEQNNFMANSFDLSTNGSVVLNRIDGNYWDKYQGYDLDRNQIGDIPYRPISLFSILSERIPPAIMLWRSFLTLIMDNIERAIPAVTPENLKDNQPAMRAYDLS
ncbi:MAG: nitrous oxide reductase family maturation protein NosD [Saprospiraceae bacterium]